MIKPLPPGWRIARLGEFIRERNGFITLDDSKTYRRVTVRLHNKGIELRDEVPGFKLKTKKQKIVNEGDLVVAEIDAKVGGFGIAPSSVAGAIVSSHYFLFAVDQTLCELGYLDACIRKGMLQEQVAAVGSTNYAAIRARHVLDYQIPLPPLAVQKRFAAILQSIDEAVRANEEVIARTRDLKKALAQELFTRGLPGRHKRFKDSPIGKIPEEWQIRPLGKCGIWRSGGTPSKANPAFWNGEIPWVSAKDMKVTHILNTLDHVTGVGIKAGTRMVPAKTLLMVVRGMILNHTFPVAIAERAVTFNQDLKALECSEDVLPDFMLHVLEHSGPDLLQRCSASTHGTRRMPMHALTGFLVKLPGLEEQQRISGILFAIAESSDTLQKSIQCLKALRSVLISTLLSGQSLNRQEIDSRSTKTS